MAKVKITMEAEIGDLEGFWPDDPQGATTENVMCVVRLMEVCLHERRIDDLVRSPKDKATREALQKHYEEDKALTQRLLASAQVEVIS
jgi:hypothetical protein